MVKCSPNYEDLFRSDKLASELLGRSIRGGVITFSAQAIKFILQAGSTMILARLLLPTDFGLIAMVTAVIAFAAMFKDAGLSMATIQRAEITHAQVSTLFWINVALSLGITLVVIALAPSVAWFYKEPRLVGITMALAGTFIFSGFTVQHQALLMRQMRYRELAIIDLGSLAIGIVIAFVMAVFGWKYWSLVGQAVATALANCVFIWFFSSWRPGPLVLRSGVRPMLSFGGHLTIASFCNQFREQFPKIMIGQALGPSLLAVYERAYQLLLLPLNQMMSPLAAVILPALSRVQNDHERLRRIARQLILLTSAISVPASVLGVLLAPEIIKIMLGDQWSRAAVIFALLSPLAATQTVSMVATWILTATGQGRAFMLFTLNNSIIAAISVVIGLRYGIEGAAIAFAGVGVMIRTPMLYGFVARFTPITWSDLLTESSVFVIAGLLLAAFGLVIRYVILDLAKPSLAWAFSAVVCLVLAWVPLAYYRGVFRLLTSLREGARQQA